MSICVTNETRRAAMGTVFGSLKDFYSSQLGIFTRASINLHIFFLELRLSDGEIVS